MPDDGQTLTAVHTAVAPDFFAERERKDQLFLQALRSNKPIMHIVQSNEIDHALAVSMMKVMITQTDCGTGFLNNQAVADEVHFYCPYVDDVLEARNEPAFEQAMRLVTVPAKYDYILRHGI